MNNLYSNIEVLNTAEDFIINVLSFCNVWMIALYFLSILKLWFRFSIFYRETLTIIYTP